MTSWLLVIWSPDFCQPHFNQFFPSLMLHNALLSSTGYTMRLPHLKAFHLWFPFYLWSIFSFLVKLTFIMPAQMALSCENWVVVQLPSCVWLFASHGLQHNKPLCPSLSPSLCPQHQWCRPAFSSYVTLFSFWPQSFLQSGFFPMIQLFVKTEKLSQIELLVLRGFYYSFFILRFLSLLHCTLTSWPQVHSS